jgi:hypothetical protein
VLTSFLDTDQASTPPSSQSPTHDPPDFLSHPDLSDAEDEYATGPGQPYPPRKGGYDSRLQQILYENPDLDIVIADAGKSPDGSYIVYRIQTGVRTGCQISASGRS